MGKHGHPHVECAQCLVSHRQVHAGWRRHQHQLCAATWQQVRLCAGRACCDGFQQFGVDRLRPWRIWCRGGHHELQVFEGQRGELDDAIAFVDGVAIADHRAHQWNRSHCPAAGGRCQRGRSAIGRVVRDPGHHPLASDLVVRYCDIRWSNRHVHSGSDGRLGDHQVSVHHRQRQQLVRRRLRRDLAGDHQRPHGRHDLFGETAGSERGRRGHSRSIGCVGDSAFHCVDADFVGGHTGRRVGLDCVHLSGVGWFLDHHELQV